MIIGWLAMLIFALHASTHMVGAGDTWVAMACGRHFIEQGFSHDTVTVEPFSANSHKAGPTMREVATWPKWAQTITEKVGLNTVKYWHPTGWVNQNWLTHVIFYWITHLSPVADADDYSFDSLVYWKFSLYIISVICVYYTGRLLGANPALSMAMACFAMFIGRTFLDIRPAGFSNMLTAIYLLILALTTYRNILYIWLIVPMAIFWCNLHGGYIYIFITLVPFTVLNFMTIISKKRFTTTGMRGFIHTAAVGVVSFLAIIIFNPFHLTNITHTFIVSISKDAKMWRSVNEWHPAFEWTNPVGTSYPFFVMYIMGIGLLVYWVLSFLLKPRLLKAPISDLNKQKDALKLFLKIMGMTAAVYLFWVTAMAFSFVNNDFKTFAVCIIFAAILLLAICKNIHFIYLLIPLIMITFNYARLKSNYDGGYIYPFAILPSYVILHSLASAFSEKIKFKKLNILFVAATAVTAIVLVFIFYNPLKVPKTGFTFDSLFSLRKIYHPKFNHNATPSYRYLLNTLYVVNLLSIVIWPIIPYLKKLFANASQKIDETIKEKTYELPKIDLPMIAIAALTVYMAIRSRRFIPIAGIVACPVLAMFITRLASVVSASRNFIKENAFYVKPMSPVLRAFFIIISLTVVITFGTRWGLKYKKIYLDPWPNDPYLNSSFMRMTASNAKPFYACQFIKMNKLEGKMFNYWTEGGFIAYGQQPDPNNGKTPLKLFMDGRAQAAYAPAKYNLWMSIMAGGPVAQNRMQRKQKIKTKDYSAIGKWINKQLRKHKVWLVMMPSNQLEKPFMKSITGMPNWQTVFFNNKQKIIVDITTKKGKKLFDGIFNGKTKYPDDFTGKLVLAHYMLAQKDERLYKQGLKLMIQAFNLNPSPIPIQEIILISNLHPDLNDEIFKFFGAYVDDFEANKDKWANENGYRYRIVAALIAADNLRIDAEHKKNKALAKSYDEKKKRYRSEMKELNNIRW